MDAAALCAVPEGTTASPYDLPRPPKRAFPGAGDELGDGLGGQARTPSGAAVPFGFWEGHGHAVCRCPCHMWLCPRAHHLPRPPKRAFPGAGDELGDGLGGQARTPPSTKTPESKTPKAGYAIWHFGGLGMQV